jgi:mitosis inhibitor protein kinase SWE1
MSDEDDLIPITTMPLDGNLTGGDEEDLFFGSSSFNRSIREDDEDLGPDDSFGWASGLSETSFSINILASTPCPRSKAFGKGVSMLEKKYKPRDSGVVMSEDEDNSSSAIPRSAGMGFGRSGSTRELPMPSASTSVSTLASSDQEFITPVLPSTRSGWSNAPVIATGSDSEGTLSLTSMRVDSAIDAFIVRTLLHVQDGDSQPKRPPGTPQKDMKTAEWFGIWTTAVAERRRKQCRVRLL